MASSHIDTDTLPELLSASEGEENWGRQPAVAQAFPGFPETREPGNGLRDALFDELQPLVTRLIHQFGEDAEQREDMRGEIYCRFCELLDSYDPARGVPLRPYLVRMLTLAVYTFTRSGWRRQHRELRLESRETGEQIAAPCDPSPGWIDRIVTEEFLEALPGAIARLPRRQRQVVVWRYYELRSFEEIAESLRVRPATARSLLRHALLGLRSRLTGATA